LSLHETWKCSSAKKPGRRRSGLGWAVRGLAWLGQQREEDLGRRRHAWKQCESEKREKERAGPGTIPAYVRWADTLADEHKWAGLRDGRGALCSKYERRPRRT
jgi:hypothetical protein